MSKKIITLALIIFISANAFAQTESASKTEQESKGFRFGLQFSPQLVWTKNGDNLTIASGVKVGFNYGLIADFSIGNNYAFATGLNISQNSSAILYKDSMKFNSTGTSLLFPASTTTTYTKLQYINIPLALKLKTNEIGYMTYFGQFGFDLGINTSAKGDIKNSFGVNYPITGDLGKDIYPFNLSLNIGAGIEYSLSKSTAFITSLSFHNGFLDISDSPRDFKTKTILNQIELRLGILF